METIPWINFLKLLNSHVKFQTTVLNIVIKKKKKRIRSTHRSSRLVVTIQIRNKKQDFVLLK